MPTTFRSGHLLVLLSFSLMAWSAHWPLAVGQDDAPKPDRPAALGLVADEPAAKHDSSRKDGNDDRAEKKKSDTKKSDTKKSDTERRGKERRGTEKGRTERKGTEQGPTEKRAAKAQREPSAKTADGSGSPGAAPQKESEAEREEAALALVREHHPALVELLERLKATKKADYQQAIRELYRDSQRLAAARQRDAERYALDLRAWQLDSRIRLLAAKLSLEDRAELEEQLKGCLTERAEVRLSLKKLERDRAAARAKKLNAEIEKLTAGQDAEVQRSLERLRRAAKKAAGGRRKEGKKATEPKTAEVADEARPKAEAARFEALKQPAEAK
ncbi:MAG TPA: hypothetical protein VF278_10545 [Pirellulales bacterium]